MPTRRPGEPRRGDRRVAREAGSPTSSTPASRSARCRRRRRIGCDLLSATGRKYLRGPRGTGFLYVRARAARPAGPPFLDLHAADVDRARQLRGARRRTPVRELGELTTPAKVGLGAATDYALEWGIDAIWERVYGLGETLRDLLRTI